MEIEIPPKKEALLVLSEFVEELEKAGVRVKITLESDKFLKKEHVKPEEVKLEEEFEGIDLDDWYYDEVEEDRIYMEPDSRLIEVLQKMWPLIFVGGSLVKGEKGMNWKNPYIVISTDYERVKVKCPFCGCEREYLGNYDSLSIPSHCECGAEVRRMIELDAYYDRITFEGDNFMAESDGKIHLGIFVNDGYFIFSRKVVELSAEDIKKASEGLLLKNLAIRGKFESIVKEAKRMGTGKAIYVPKEWNEVLAIRLH